MLLHSGKPNFSGGKMIRSISRLAFYAALLICPAAALAETALQTFNSFESNAVAAGSATLDVLKTLPGSTLKAGSFGQTLSVGAAITESYSAVEQFKSGNPVGGTITAVGAVGSSVQAVVPVLGLTTATAAGLSTTAGSMTAFSSVAANVDALRAALDTGNKSTFDKVLAVATPADALIVQGAFGGIGALLDRKNPIQGAAMGVNIANGSLVATQIVGSKLTDIPCPAPCSPPAAVWNPAASLSGTAATKSSISGATKISLEQLQPRTATASSAPVPTNNSSTTASQASTITGLGGTAATAHPSTITTSGPKVSTITPTPKVTTPTVKLTPAAPVNTPVVHTPAPTVRTPTVAVRVPTPTVTVHVPTPTVHVPTPTVTVRVPTVSDARLKRDIVAVGELPDGLHLYRYRYLWSSRLYVGVMAQEVLAVAPDAVVRGNDGYLRVDYGRLGLRLTTWDRWIGRRSISSR